MAPGSVVFWLSPPKTRQPPPEASNIWPEEIAIRQKLLAMHKLFFENRKLLAPILKVNLGLFVSSCRHHRHPRKEREREYSKMNQNDPNGTYGRSISGRGCFINGSTTWWWPLVAWPLVPLVRTGVSWRLSGAIIFSFFFIGKFKRYRNWWISRLVVAGERRLTALYKAVSLAGGCVGNNTLDGPLLPQGQHCMLRGARAFRLVDVGNEVDTPPLSFRSFFFLFLW